MKKAMIALSLSLGLTMVNGFTVNAEELPPQPKTLVQELNEVTGNYIGFDMTEADKLQVLNAIIDSARNATSYTVRLAIDAVEENGENLGLVNTQFWNNGSTCDVLQIRYNEETMEDMVYIIDGKLYANAGEDNSFWEEEDLSYLSATKNENTYSIEQAVDRGTIDIEYLAKNSVYHEDENGVPYLILQYQSDIQLLNAVNNMLDALYIDNVNVQNYLLTIRFPLNNYGSFFTDFQITMKTDSLDSDDSETNYFMTMNYNYIDVNTTNLPPLPEGYTQVDF